VAFRLEHIYFSYRDTPIFRDVNLAFNYGRFYGILGPNGSGKTTLLDLVCRHLEPDRGRIMLDGRSLETYSRRLLARKLALVPQQYVIGFPFTVREVVLMGRYAHLPRFAAPGKGDLELVEKVLAETDTLDLAHRRITELSGGERQRVVFARALAQHTPVLILDEATANLDINHALGLLRCVSRRVARDDCCAIAVFQDINLAAAFCTHLVLLERGKVVAAGTKQEVLTADNLARVFRVPAHVRHDDFAGTLQVVFAHSQQAPKAGGQQPC